MKVLTMQDLQNQRYTQTASGIWVVDNLLRTNRKRISLLCGSPHAGKSTLARQLSVAVVKGEPFLGRMTLKSKVAYWQSEETEDDAREDFERSGMALDEPNFNLLHADGSENNLTALNDVLVNDPTIRLVIIETLDDFLQMDDLGENPSARRAFEKFDAEVVARHTDHCNFLALHHFKKSDEQRGSSITKILGATVIAGKTDCKIFMRGCGDDDPRRVISVRTRKGIPIESTYLTFDEVTQTSTLGLTLADEKHDSKKAKVSVNASELRERCINVVAQNPMMSKSEACKQVGGHRETVMAVFDSLIGNVIEVKLGGATGTAHLLTLKQPEPLKPEPHTPLEDVRSSLASSQTMRANFKGRANDIATLDAQIQWAKDEISRLENLEVKETI